MFHLFIPIYHTAKCTYSIFLKTFFNVILLSALVCMATESKWLCRPSMFLHMRNVTWFFASTIMDHKAPGNQKLRHLVSPPLPICNKYLLGTLVYSKMLQWEENQILIWNWFLLQCFITYLHKGNHSWWPLVASYQWKWMDECQLLLQLMEVLVWAQRRCCGTRGKGHLLRI